MIQFGSRLARYPMLSYQWSVGWRKIPSVDDICFSAMELQKPDLVSICTVSCAVYQLFWGFGIVPLTPFVLRNFVIYPQTFGFDASNFVSVVVVSTCIDCQTFSTLVNSAHAIVNCVCQVVCCIIYTVQPDTIHALVYSSQQCRTMSKL